MILLNLSFVRYNSRTCQWYVEFPGDSRRYVVDWLTGVLVGWQELSVFAA